MSRRRAWRSIAVVAALMAGLAGGGLAGLVAQGTPRPSIPGPESAGSPSASSPPAPTPAIRPAPADTLLAWTPGALPPGFASAVARNPAVTRSVAVVSGTLWMTRSASPGGVTVDRPKDGLAIPIEVAAAPLADYAPFLPPQDRALLPALAGGAGALGATSAELRRFGAGGTLRFGRRSVRIAGVVPDSAIGAHELFVSNRTAAVLGLRTERYLLIDPRPGVAEARMRAILRGLLPPGTLLQVRGPGETPFFRQGDAVLPPVRLKQLFGEFAARPMPNGWFRMDPAWTRVHVVRARVPILGVVRCNRAVVAQLRGALAQLRDAGLGGLIHPSEYGGCFAPRFANRDPAEGVSHHSWGVAIDLNVAENLRGRVPTMDPRVVAAFERWGFTWGGRWIIPDGMHFEFARFASGA
ncbi:MAG: M15 family metallopeptidase [Actinomycetota bacterium]